MRQIIAEAGKCKSPLHELARTDYENDIDLLRICGIISQYERHYLSE